MRVWTALLGLAAMVVVGGGTAYADGAPSAGVSQGGSGVVWGAVRYVALPAPGGTSVAQIDSAGGTVNGFVSLRGSWGIPIVAFDGTTSGVSAGGQTLVLAQSSQTLLPSRSRFALVNPVKMRLQRVVTLRGRVLLRCDLTGRRDDVPDPAHVGVQHPALRRARV